MGNVLVATVNVNGIRAAVNRGFADWLAVRNCDVVALQEVRCAAELLPSLPGYHLSYHQGDLPGRNGVALLTRSAPSEVRLGFGHRFDHEGRYLEADFPGVTIASLYLPKGDVPDGDEKAQLRFQHKMTFMAAFRRYLTIARRKALASGREFLVMGDFNIAHERCDLRNWRSNNRSSGFLPVEREWFSTLLGPRTLHDVVRRLRPGEDGPYSWWSWRGAAFDNDTGWRIDYHLATPGLASRASSAVVDREASYAERLSDHAPVVVEYLD